MKIQIPLPQSSPCAQRIPVSYFPESTHPFAVPSSEAEHVPRGAHSVSLSQSGRQTPPTHPRRNHGSFRSHRPKAAPPPEQTSSTQRLKGPQAASLSQASPTRTTRAPISGNAAPKAARLAGFANPGAAGGPALSSAGGLGHIEMRRSLVPIAGARQQHGCTNHDDADPSRRRHEKASRKGSTHLPHSQRCCVGTPTQHLSQPPPPTE